MAVVYAAVRPHCNTATVWPAVPEFSLICRLGLEERYLLAGRKSWLQIRKWNSEKQTTCQPADITLDENEKDTIQPM